MLLFKKKLNADKKGRKPSVTPPQYVDSTALRQNNITRLTIDERWTKLFASLPMSPAIEKIQNEMNELIKKEAMLKNEQESLEPAKRKTMNRIMSLTKDAFEDNSDEAKSQLKECRKEIERINDRMEKILEDIEKIDSDLKETNIKLLNETIGYIFSTLRSNKDRAEAIVQELSGLEKREKELREELDSINLDWTSFAVNFTGLLGSDLVNKLENQFGLEGLKHETDNSGADAEN